MESRNIKDLSKAEKKEVIKGALFALPIITIFVLLHLFAPIGTIEKRISMQHG